MTSAAAQTRICDTSQDVLPFVYGGFSLELSPTLAENIEEALGRYRLTHDGTPPGAAGLRRFVNDTRAEAQVTARRDRSRLGQDRVGDIRASTAPLLHLADALDAVVKQSVPGTARASVVEIGDTIKNIRPARLYQIGANETWCVEFIDHHSGDVRLCRLDTLGRRTKRVHTLRQRVIRAMLASRGFERACGVK